MRREVKGIMLMLCSSLCVCVGQLFWKLSAVRGGNWIFLMAGFAVYGIGALVMIFAYRFGRLSVLQPVLSSTYALSLLLGAFVLNERVSVLKCVGIAVLICGLLLIAGGASSPSAKTEEDSIIIEESKA